MQSYRDFLRVLFVAAVESSRGEPDLRRLAIELRRGRLPDELAYMLDQASQHFREPAQSNLTEEVKAIERIIKANRVSKATLINVITSLQDEFRPSLSATVRDILLEFQSISRKSEIEKLRDTLGAMRSSDQFIKGITSKAAG